MQWVRSGCMVGEWLPQTIMRRTSAARRLVFLASMPMARLWSRRIMAVNRSLGRPGALAAAIMALVLAGLPTTMTRTSRAAYSSIARP